MKALFKLSALALLAIFLFNGCKKDLLLKTASPSPGKTNSSNSIPDSMVMTPQGLMLKSHVFEIESGYHLEIRGNRMLKVKTATGEMTKDLGMITFNDAAQSPSISPPQGQANPASGGARNLAVTQSNSSGWVTYSEWNAGATTPIGTLSTKWDLPATPPSHTQIIYIGDGISHTQYSASGNPLVIQPILEWGNNGIATTGTHWTVSSWCCWSSTSAAYTTPVTVTSTNSPFQGVITLTGQQTDGSYNYTSAFTGISNTTLTVIEATNNAAGNTITFPNVPILSWAYETLQSYGMSGATDYPAQNSVHMDTISLQTGLPGSFTHPSTIPWTATTGTAASYGEHTVIVNNGSSFGEVDLWFHSAAPVISYPPSETYPACGAAITPITPGNTGGPSSTWIISPALPAGLGISATTGVISGTPTAASPSTNYTVTATNTGGSSHATINITITGPISISYPATEVYNQSTVITAVYPTISGTAPTSYSISPNLTTNTGLSFSTTTGEIYGTPTIPCAPTSYTITGTNGTCMSTGTINIAVAFLFTFYNHITGNVTPPSSNYGSISVTFKYATTSVQYYAGVVYEGNTVTFWLPPGNYNVVCNPAYYLYPTNCSFYFDGGSPPGPSQYNTPGATFSNVPLSATNSNDLSVHN